MKSTISLSTTEVNSAFYVITGMCVFLLILITFLMVYFVIKYHRKRNPVSSYIVENAPLEVVWTILPTILVLIMFFYGSEEFAHIRDVPGEAYPVTVIARQWEWSFSYPNGKQSKVLVVPVNKPILLYLESRDVVHSFYVPAFRIKEDAVPNLKNYLWFQAKTKGSYDVLCSEYCGLKHSEMISRVAVTDENTFNRWLASEESDFPEGSKAPDISLISKKGCAGCHSSDGTERVGPTFKGLFGHEITVRNGKTPKKIFIDEEYLRLAIKSHGHATKTKRKTVIPKIGDDLTERDIDEIIDYLRKLE